MPKKLEQKLLNQATALGKEGREKDAYVYGTMRETGWVPEREKRKKTQGEAMVKALRLRR